METFQLERTIPFGSKSQFPAKVRAKSKEEIGNSSIQSRVSSLRPANRSESKLCSVMSCRHQAIP
jgi:hypothetical protein